MIADGSRLLEQARALSKAGRLDDSQKIYAQLVTTPGLEVEGLYGLGVISMQRRDLGRAQSFFQSAIRRNPNHSNSLFQLGEISAKLQNRDQAIQLYSQALTANPQLAIARTRLEGLGATNASQPGSNHPPVGGPGESSGSQVDAMAARPDSGPTDKSDVNAAARELGGKFGIYELLKQDSSPLSKQAVELIDSVSMRRRLGFSARLGCVMNYLIFVVASSLVGYFFATSVFGIK